MKHGNKLGKLAITIAMTLAMASYIGMTAYAEEPLADNPPDINAPAEGLGSAKPDNLSDADGKADSADDVSTDEATVEKGDGKKDLAGEALEEGEAKLNTAEGAKAPEPQAEPGLSVTGGTAGVDYTYENGVLTFLNDGSYTISMADGVSTTSDRIVIKNSAQSELTLTLDNVHMDTTADSAIYAEYGSASEWTMNYILVGDNTITADQQPISNDRGNANTTVSGGLLALTSTSAPRNGYNQWNNKDFTLESGTITINNGNIMAMNSIYINGGALDISPAYEGLYAINEIVMTGGDVTIDTDYNVGVHVPSANNIESGGIQILGGTLEVTTRGSGSGAIAVGTNGSSSVTIDTPDTVKLHCNPDVTSIGILARNGSPVTITDGITTMDGCVVGIYFYANGDAELTVGGDDTEVEIISSTRAINPYNSNMRDVTFKESYIHKNYDGADQALRAEVSDEDLTDENGRSKPYVLITPAWEITYDLGTGHLEEGVTNPEKYSRIDEFTLNNPVPDAPAIEFLGWTGTDLEEPTVDVTVPAKSKGARTYTANYRMPLPVYDITYNLNGGIYNGSTDNIVETYDEGTVIGIHAAPTREGYTFQHWEGSKYQPGDSYTVTENHTFTAQWKKNDTPSPAPKPSPGGNGTHTPSTGDEVSIILPVVFGVVALIVLLVAALARKRMRR